MKINYDNLELKEYMPNYGKVGPYNIEVKIRKERNRDFYMGYIKFYTDDLSQMFSYRPKFSQKTVKEINRKIKEGLEKYKKESSLSITDELIWSK